MSGCIIFATMSEKDQLKLLAKFSQQSAESCSLAWLGCAGDFWAALHQLSTPKTSRAALLGDLDPARPEVAYAGLQKLRQHFASDAYLEAWMRIEDEDLQANYQEPDTFFLPMQKNELDQVVLLLEQCSGGDLVRAAIQLLYDWAGPLPFAAVQALQQWVQHYDASIAGAAIRVFVEFPAAVPQVLDAYEAILTQGKTPQRYDVAWTLWTLAGKGHHFPRLREAYHKVAYLGSETEQHFMRNLLK